MTFDASEKSRYGGKPVECFEFHQGGRAWRWTSADRVLLFPTGQFEPIAISREGLEFSEEDTGENIEIRVPRDNEVAALFIGDLPSSPVQVWIFRAHRGEELYAIAWFTGEVNRARFEESQAILVCRSTVAALDREFPTLSIQIPCNHVLYSGRCGANPTTSRDVVSITTVNGATLISNDFGVRPDQWYRGGRLETFDSSERRFIADHVGNTVKLISPMPGLVSGAQVWAVWGCNHLETDCGPKFNNLPNHLGWKRLPKRNPWEGRLD